MGLHASMCAQWVSLASCEWLSGSRFLSESPPELPGLLQQFPMQIAIALRWSFRCLAIGNFGNHLLRCTHRSACHLRLSIWHAQSRARHIEYAVR